MSTGETYPPAAPKPSGMSTGWKILLGCTIGCLVMIGLACIAGVLFTTRVVMPVAQQAQGIEQSRRRAEEAAGKLRALDAAHPPQLPADISSIVLTNDDLDRYARLRRALDEPLRRIDASGGVLDAMTPEGMGDHPSVTQVLGMITGAVAGVGESTAAWADMAEAAQVELEKEGMGPTDLGRMAEVVEWRFLRRPEAMPLGLSPGRRREAAEVGVRLRFLRAFSQAKNAEAWRRGRGDFERELKDAEGRWAELTAEAEAAKELAPKTRELLEARRAEVEALGGAGVAVLADVAEPPPVVRATGMGMGQSPRSRRHGPAEQEPPH